mgnify:CR=1 FL=1
MEIKQGIPEEKRLEVITWAFEYFKHVTPEDYFFAIIAQETNWDLSESLLSTTFPFVNHQIYASNDQYSFWISRNNCAFLIAARILA